MTDEDFAPLAQGARVLGLELTEEQVALFARFRRELLDWNQRVNLTAIADPSELLLGHGEYDLALRCTEGATAIRHVPRVLCERGAAAIETPEQEAAIEEYARRLQSDAAGDPLTTPS